MFGHVSMLRMKGLMLKLRKGSTECIDDGKIKKECFRLFRTTLLWKKWPMHKESSGRGFECKW